MAHNDSPDNEMDQDMERVLREHFDADASDLRSPNDPWEWLESRMDETQTPSFLSRMLGAVAPLWQVRPSPVFAGAGVAVVAVAVAVAVWAASGDGGPESSGGMASVPPTAIPASTSLQTVPPVSTQAALTQTNQQEQDEPPTIAAQRAESDQGSVEDSTQTAAVLPPTQAPVPPTASPPSEVAMEEEVMVEVEKVASGAMATPAAGPHATMAPSMEAMRGPRGPAGSPPPTGTGSGWQPPIVPPSDVGTPPATTFRDYERQQFVSTAEDAVSTFSLDTDRTSYHLALNIARAGYEVPVDSVRAEEWLNAFNYEYDLPSSSVEFAITSDLYPHPLDENKRLARITFQAPEIVIDRPLNVTLVLDASGSMGGRNRVAVAKQAAESIRQSLGEDDRIAVVQFSKDVLDHLTVYHSAPDDENVQRSISRLEPTASTNVQAGLNLGVGLAAEAREDRPNSYNYVILMSDGVANVDATDPFGILETAFDPDSHNPLRLITIGVGIENYNDLLLEQLAQHGNGWYRYLDTPDQAQATFTRENWLALSTPFADQTRAQVTWYADIVDRWRIVGYENRVTAAENFTQDRREFAEIYSGSATTVFYELEMTEASNGLSNVVLGQIEVRWVEPDSGDSMGQMVSLTGGPAADFVGRDGSLALFAAIVALAADLYGSLPSNDDEASAGVFDELVELAGQLGTLDGELGSLDSYNDFQFLLDYIIEDVEERLPPSARSGYSR